MTISRMMWQSCVTVSGLFPNALDVIIACCMLIGMSLSSPMLPCTGIDLLPLLVSFVGTLFLDIKVCLVCMYTHMTCPRHWSWGLIISGATETGEPLLHASELDCEALS